MNAKFEEILNRVSPDILDSEGLDLMEEGIIDSFMIMHIVSLTEDVFGIDFDPEDILPENFASPEAIWKTIQKYGVKD